MFGGNATKKGATFFVLEDFSLLSIRSSTNVSRLWNFLVFFSLGSLVFCIFFPRYRSIWNADTGANGWPVFPFFFFLFFSASARKRIYIYIYIYIKGTMKKKNGWTRFRFTEQACFIAETDFLFSYFSFLLERKKNGIPRMFLLPHHHHRVAFVFFLVGGEGDNR